jgi:calcineurin-like phosphoesterase family protein
MGRRRWVIADTHFGEDAAVTTFRRPFGDAREMDDRLVEAINERVGRGDELLHLGDVFGAIDWENRGARDDARRLLDRIRCRRVRLVLGNKDPDRRSFRGMFRSAEHFRSLRAELPDGTRARVVCCHYPLRQWRGMMDGALHLHGHVHGSLAAHGRSMDVGVDCNAFAPLALDEVVAALAARPVQPPL